MALCQMYQKHLILGKILSLQGLQKPDIATTKKMKKELPFLPSGIEKNYVVKKF